MKKELIFLSLLFLLLIHSCKEEVIVLDPLLEVLDQAPPMVKDMIDSAVYEIQIIYTQVDRDQEGNPHLQSFYINRDDERYFYPASTVKMPVAFLALQKINELRRENPEINRYSRLEHGVGHPPQQAVSVDSSSSTLYPNVAHYVEQIFSVSDNDAYNRLYEFLGQDYINEELRDKGVFRSSRIRTRVGISGFDTESNRFTNPIKIKNNDGVVLYEQEEYEAIYNQFVDLKESIKGVGFYDDETESVIEEPFDLSEKNFINLVDLENSLRRIIFPEQYDPSEQFDLSKQQYEFLYEVMPKTPLDFSFHKDHTDEYYDSYVKFFYNGDSKEPIPDHVKIFNKVGWAYGTLTDCSYIADVKNNIEYFLTATILVNRNGIFNDGNYEYEEKGLPFFSKLGEAVYNYELKRKRHNTPDLSKYNQ